MIYAFGTVPVPRPASDKKLPIRELLPEDHLRRQPDIVKAFIQCCCFT
ncbi:MAG: hypothetical protein WDO19_23950 [Bacteroidota bacterium]